MGTALVGHVKNLRALGSVIYDYPAEYTLVASVELEEGSDEDLLNKVFELTNSISCPWWENQGVTLLVKNGTRSSSVGDVVVLPNGNVYRCAMVGWTLVTSPSEKNGLTVSAY